MLGRNGCFPHTVSSPPKHFGAENFPCIFQVCLSFTIDHSSPLKKCVEGLDILQQQGPKGLKILQK